MYGLIRPFLFRMPPEKAHTQTIRLFRFALSIPGMKGYFKRQYVLKDPALHRKLFNLDFPNPVGLAAGFDKDGKYMHEMARLGFGFVEVGTVTPRPQQGNPQPRLFRLKEDEGLINRMGFNNEGVEALVERLKNRPKGLIVGGNIGKNKDTPNEQAIGDYIYCFRELFPYVDYFVVNVSSPNTPGLRELQDKEPLTQLLSMLQVLNLQGNQPKPILLKIAPDLSNEQLDDIIEIVQTTNIAGLIATNTTIERDGLQTDAERIAEIGNGGLSGAPLRQRATDVIRYLAEKSNGEIPIIAVGGIDSAEAALEKLEAGASLVQIYTGLIYKGPTLPKAINAALLHKSQKN